VDVAVRLTLIAIILIACFRIFSPFLTAVVWGIVIAIALFPVFNAVKAKFGGRNRLTGTLFIVLALAILLVPTFILTESAIDEAIALKDGLENGTLEVPPPPAKVQEWPLIGKGLHRLWHNASVDLDATMGKLAPQLKELAAKLASAVAGVGAAIVQSIFAIIIAGLLMMTSTGGSRAAHDIGRRLAGQDGVEIVDISVDTIRSVVRGVLLVAIIQGLLAAIGLYVASVPAVGLWTLLVMIVAVMQLPPILILGPIAAWVFSANDSTTISVGFLIWSLIVSGSDGFLKPIFLGRGVKVPMLVILIGAIGGMLRSGVIGLFIGPVILAIGYQLFVAWMAEVRSSSSAPTTPEPASE
jgi:predicted PurR-regulated permease PerM